MLILNHEIHSHVQIMADLLNLEKDVCRVILLLTKTIQNGNKIIVCVNGGSAVDGQQYKSGNLLKGAGRTQ